MALKVEDIIKEGITEVIVTTVSRSGAPNAAPMGVVASGGRFFIRMYTDTTTFRNVSETGYLVANFTADPRVYVISAFRELPGDLFQPEKGLVPPRLKDAAGWIYFKCTVGDVVEMEPVSLKAERCTLPTFSRAFAAVVEATIVGTRLRFYRGDEGRKKILEYESVVKKCGSPRDIEAIIKLKELLGLD
jgi:uncharacterized protein